MFPCRKEGRNRCNVGTEDQIEIRNSGGYPYQRLPSKGDEECKDRQGEITEGERRKNVKEARREERQITNVRKMTRGYCSQSFPREREKSSRISLSL